MGKGVYPGMIKKLIIDPEYGMAGDMFTAALLSVGAPESRVLDVMKSAAAPLGKVTIRVIKEVRDNVPGIYLHISLDESLPGMEVTRAYEHLKNMCVENGIKGEYKDFVLRALTILGEAEQKAHSERSMGPGHSHHHPHLHEAQDIIIDLAGAACGMQELGIPLSSVVCLSPVSVGGGTITFSHGTLDVPAPATAHIIKDFSIPVVSGPVEKELFTPTGAAILSALEPEFLERTSYTLPPKSEHLLTGTGFGSMRFQTGSAELNALYIYIPGGEK